MSEETPAYAGQPYTCIHCGATVALKAMHTPVQCRDQLKARVVVLSQALTASVADYVAGLDTALKRSDRLHAWIEEAPLYHAPACVLAGRAVLPDGPHPDYACTCDVGAAQIRRRELLRGNAE